MPTRNSKIANLPNDIREQLNLRLHDGESGKELVAWLNALPKVQSVLASQFNASPISEVNLTLWRQGGYLQWLTERECFDSARALADGDCHLATTGFSAERLLNVLTVRIGQLLMRWVGAPGDGASDADAFTEVARKARILQGISRSVLAIHRIQSQRARERPDLARPVANSLNRSEEHAPSSPVMAGCLAAAKERGAPSLTAEVLAAEKERGEPRLAGEVLVAGKEGGSARNPQSAKPSGVGAGGGLERGEPIRDPQFPSAPSSISANLSHTPFKPDLDFSEILDAV